MSRHYEEYKYKDITRELLDGIKVGDCIRINEWKRGMKVHGVSKNHILIGQKAFGNTTYSVIKKEMWTGQHNAMDRNTFLCGPDDMIFGFFHEHAYELDNEDFVRCYLDSFEDGTTDLSRRSVSIYNIAIRRA